MKMRKLPESELEIMIALWAADGPVPRNYFDKKLKERKNWADSTILSYWADCRKRDFCPAVNRAIVIFICRLFQRKNIWLMKIEVFFKNFTVIRFGTWWLRW